MGLSLSSLRKRPSQLPLPFNTSTSVSSALATNISELRDDMASQTPRGPTGQQPGSQRNAGQASFGNGSQSSPAPAPATGVKGVLGQFRLGHGKKPKKAPSQTASAFPHHNPEVEHLLAQGHKKPFGAHANNPKYSGVSMVNVMLVSLADRSPLSSTK